MGTSLFLNQIKKQASSFLQEKYKSARLAFTDVSQAELLAEEATNTDPWGPDAKTMTVIAEASFEMDDYWRIVDVLHRRLYNVDWKQWRQAYKSLVLLEFLLTHGAEELAEEFDCHLNVIQELGSFELIDHNGLNWGEKMQKKSERIEGLLEGGETLKEARLQALKITKEIEGFGNLMVSPSSSSSSGSSSNRASSFGSYSSSSSAWNDPLDELSINKHELQPANDQALTTESSTSAPGGKQEKKLSVFPTIDEDSDQGSHHLWINGPALIEEMGSLIHQDEDDEEEEDDDDDREITEGNFEDAIRSKLEAGSSPSLRSRTGERVILRSFSDAGKAVGKKLHRQFSTRY